MEHKEGCRFLDIIEQASRGSWKDGSGENSGYVYITEDYISFSDGWNHYPSLDFTYCPCCGVYLVKENNL